MQIPSQSLYPGWHDATPPAEELGPLPGPCSVSSVEFGWLGYFENAMGEVFAEVLGKPYEQIADKLATLTFAGQGGAARRFVPTARVAVTVSVVITIRAGISLLAGAGNDGTA